MFLSIIIIAGVTALLCNRNRYVLVIFAPLALIAAIANPFFIFLLLVLFCPVFYIVGIRSDDAKREEKVREQRKRDREFWKSLSDKEKREYSRKQTIEEAASRMADAWGTKEVKPELVKRWDRLPEHMSDGKIRYLINGKIIKTKRENHTEIDRLNHRAMNYILEHDIDCLNRFIDYCNGKPEVEYLFAQARLIAIFPQTREAREQVILNEKVELTAGAIQDLVNSTERINDKEFSVLTNEIKRLSQSITQEQRTKYSVRIKALESEIKKLKKDNGDLMQDGSINSN